jgi:putative ABC transport system permease protein
MPRVPLATRNLLHNRRRLAAALAGVVFAVVLVNVEVGILRGFLANATGFIDRLPADVWVMAQGTPNFDMSHNIPEETLGRVRSVPGVEWSEKLYANWGLWKTSAGNDENVQIIGLLPGGRISLPWPTEPAGAAQLDQPEGILIDRAEQARLKVRGLGDLAELSGRRVKVAGFTEGLRSFTTSPYVIMRFDEAARVAIIPGSSGTGGMSYVLAGAVPGLAPEALRDRLRAELDGVEVLTASEFRSRTQRYWLLTTGVGMAFLMASILGFVVGGAVVGQVLYAMIAEQRAEFGVLKAMGAGRWLLCRIVAGQAILIALTGFGAGLLLTLPLEHLVRAAGTPIAVGWDLLAAGLAAILVVCVAAAVLPALQILRLEPAMVFRG